MLKPAQNAPMQEGWAAGPTQTANAESQAGDGRSARQGSSWQPQSAAAPSAAVKLCRSTRGLCECTGTHGGSDVCVGSAWETCTGRCQSYETERPCNCALSGLPIRSLDRTLAPSHDAAPHVSAVRSSTSNVKRSRSTRCLLPV